MKMQKMIDIHNLIFRYPQYDENGKRMETKQSAALEIENMTVKKGDFVAILGHNGSGKSTLARQINALLYPESGEVIVDGMTTTDQEKVWEIRKTAGMIFQNPDNQIIGTVVDEDVAFGMENIGVPTDEMIGRVKKSLKAVDMDAYAEVSPNQLSGGQKQRVAVAGILAMEADCMIFDEATAMLDPKGRQQVVNIAQKLNREKGITILFITHYMEEALMADHIIVMDHGKVKLQGTPKEVFLKTSILNGIGLEMPETLKIYDVLKKKEWIQNCDDTLFDIPEVSLVEAYQRKQLDILADHLMGDTNEIYSELEKMFQNRNGSVAENKISMILQNISYCYQTMENQKVYALKNISMELQTGKCTAFIGHTGSGKSTCLNILSGLISPESGEMRYNGEDTSAKKYDRFGHHKKVGIVFQYPEQQLFEATVWEDVIFGPKNFGFAKEKQQEAAKQALQMVGIPEELYSKSPLELSGGQKRRVAIAGVLASDPEFILLDEPAAGLDPQGKKEIFDLMERLKEQGKGIVFISHSMDDVCAYADAVYVFENGEISAYGTPKQVFQNAEKMEQMQLGIPVIMEFESIVDRKTV